MNGNGTFFSYVTVCKLVFSVTVSNMIYRQIPDKNDKRSLASACFDMSYFVRSWISRGSGWQTERADCNYLKK